MTDKPSSTQRLKDVIKELRPHAVWESIKILAGSAIITSFMAAIAKWTKNHVDVAIIVSVFSASAIILMVITVLTLAGAERSLAAQPQSVRGDFAEDHVAQANNVGGEANEIRARLSEANAERTRLLEENRELRSKVARMSSLDLRVWALLNTGYSVDLDFIMRNLQKAGDRATEAEVLSLIGAFLREGRIEHDRTSLASYRPVKQS